MVKPLYMIIVVCLFVVATILLLFSNTTQYFQRLRVCNCPRNCRCGCQQGGRCMCNRVATKCRCPGNCRCKLNASRIQPPFLPVSNVAQPEPWYRGNDRTYATLLWQQNQQPQLMPDFGPVTQQQMYKAAQASIQRPVADSFASTF